MSNDVQDALERIKAFKSQTTPRADGWKLDVSVWRMVGEGGATFALAFLVGLGIGILYNIITTVAL